MKQKGKGARERNEAFLETMYATHGIHRLPDGVCYVPIVPEGSEGNVTPESVVTIAYAGSLIDGKTFDMSSSNFGDAFRVRDLIPGMQTALTHMHLHDHWRVFIPWQQGYGKKAYDGIPGYSTLIFEIRLMAIS